MEIHYTRRQTGRFESPVVPVQRLESPTMPPTPSVSPSVPPAPPMPQRIPGTSHSRRKPRKRPSIRRAWLVVPLIVAVLAGAAVFTIYMIPGSIGNAAVGDCASFDRSSPQQPYSTVRCSAAQADFVVLQVIQGPGNCRDVAGATRSTEATEGTARREICMGTKDADPAAAVNVAQVGDCLTGTSGGEKRVPCSNPAATLRILKRLNNISTTQVSTACDGVPEANSVYSWTWDTDDGTGPAVASYQTDAVFCLGRIR